MQANAPLPAMTAADDRRVPGWRVLREYLKPQPDAPFLRISSECRELIRSLPLLLCDSARPEDASSEPHSATHAPEALRYAVMSRAAPFRELRSSTQDFHFPKHTSPLI